MNHWPKLDCDTFQETYDFLDMTCQIVGKYRLANTVWLNHSWQATFYVDSKGLTSSCINEAHQTFEARFDFVHSELVIQCSDGNSAQVPLKSQSVAEFYQNFRSQLESLGANPNFHRKPNEVDPSIPFAEQTKILKYDAQAALDYWKALQRIARVFEDFRSGYIGKVSPVHYFWGSADLAVTRFSGREAPLHPGGIPALPDAVAQEAYSHEVSSAGFWKGKGLGYPAFYSYAYPSPDGFEKASIEPFEAFFSKELGEFVLSYEVVRASDDPEAKLMQFLESSYLAAADLGNWDRAALECERGRPGVPRALLR